MKLSYSEEQRRLLLLCGVPLGLLIDSTIDYNKLLVPVTEEKDGKIICNFKTSDQKKSIEKAKDIFNQKHPTLIVFHSSSDFLQLRRFAVPWFFNAVRHCKDELTITRGSLPVWNYVDTSFTDGLLDILRGRDDNINFQDYQPLLCLDGIYTDSGNNKIDKLRDILNLCSEHHVFLLLSGVMPYTFCSERLGLPITNIISFGHNRIRNVL